MSKVNSIRVKSKDAYIIEVNDNGDTIEFDVTDIELPFRLERAKKMAADAQKWLKGQQVIIAKKQDTAKKGDLMTAKERATLEAYRECFKRMREAVDEFAGAGASDKIFGNKDYLEMFNDFMAEMEPHFDAMQLKTVDIRKRIEEKYSSAAGDEI